MIVDVPVYARIPFVRATGFWHQIQTVEYRASDRPTLVITRCGLRFDAPDIPKEYRPPGMPVPYDQCPECEHLPPFWPL